MPEGTLIKLQKKCFFIALICLPFLTIRLGSVMYFFGNFMNAFFLDKLTAYILPFAMILAVCIHLRDRSFFIKPKLFIKFYLVSWCLLSLSEAVGIYLFDLSRLIYYQHEFVFIIVELVKQLGLNPDPYLARCFSYWCDLVYNSSTYLLWTYGVAYWIYCLYYQQSKELISTCFKAGLVCFSFIFLYACVEVGYFWGAEWAENILVTVNPYFYQVNYSYNNWPPLLMTGKIHRMRTIFAEPSYMGIYFAFLMPFIWYGFLKSVSKYRLGWLTLDFCAFLMMFLTRSRTAYGITIVQLFLLVGLVLWQRHREYYHDLKKLVVCCLFAAVVANGITGINVTGIDNLQNGSNNARWGYTVATAKIGLAYPVFGTGSELFNYYVEEYSPDFTRINKGYTIWIDYFNKNGLRSAYPQMCEYSTRFAQSGIIGLGLILLPFLGVLYKFMQRLRQDRAHFLSFATVLISLVAMAVTGFSNHINISYCYWFILGIAADCITERT